MALDWGAGSYELTAAELLVAARIVVDTADPQQGERVIDLGCGTGNAAFLAAERGAVVTGVDPAERLLDVAVGHAAHEPGIDAVFIQGTAEQIPLPDSCADLVVSVFGVIFAGDAEQAAAEMKRVLAPNGRIVLSAWLPEGPIFEAGRATRMTMGGDLARPVFPWHDAEALSELLGFEVTHGLHTIPFTHTSPEAWVDEWFDAHPVWVAAREQLEPLGQLGPLRERLVEILGAANQDPAAFLVNSTYVVATARAA
jgi:SAM-dependent methyltransferase